MGSFDSLIIIGMAAAAIGFAVFAVFNRFTGGRTAFENRYWGYSTGIPMGDFGTAASAGMEGAAGKDGSGPILDKIISRLIGTDFLDNLRNKLMQADLPFLPHEWLIIEFLASMTGFILAGHFFNGIYLQIGTAVGVWLCLHLTLKILANKRLEKFDRQLADALDLINTSLRAGHSFMQALEVVTPELPDPIGKEFKRVMHQTNLGMNLEASLKGLVKRVPTPNLEITVAGFLIQRDTGGSLSEVLTKISQTIRDRIQVQGEIKTLTTQGKLSGVVVGLMPFIVGGVLNVISPDYLLPLFEDPRGRLMLIAMLVSEAVGAFFISRIVKIDF